MSNGNPIDSLSTDPEDVLKDYAQATMQELQRQDQIPAGWGNNSPLFGDGPVTAEGVWNQAKQGFAAQRQAQGGSSTDQPMTPTGENYVARRTSMLTAEEGTRPQAYDDKTGLPVRPGVPVQGKTTVAVGFNMDKPAARAEWDAAFQGNGPDFDAVHSGRATLSPPQINTLTSFLGNTFDGIVSKQTQGIDLSEHQRLALVSLAYNGPSLLSGPVAALRNGDYAGAAQAIRNIPLNNARRQREAAMFAGA